MDYSMIGNAITGFAFGCVMVQAITWLEAQRKDSGWNT